MFKSSNVLAIFGYRSVHPLCRQLLAMGNFHGAKERVLPYRSHATQRAILAIPGGVSLVFILRARPVTHLAV